MGEYVINLVVGVAVFFNLRWVLRKLIKQNKLRIVLTWGGTIILTPIIYYGMTIAFVLMLFYQPKKDFDKEKWFARRELRHEMRDDIITSGILKGKTKKEIADLIGSPDYESDTTDIWRYDLGASFIVFRSQQNSLSVTFDSNRVVNVEKHEYHD